MRDGVGSPPQVRGKQRNFILHIGAARITPAGAGKTCRKATLASASRDHPRRCGENITAPDELGNVLGSPPQVRGKRSGTNIYSSVGSDHPRRCGENHCSNRIDRQDNGSPPQVRGKRHFLASSNFRLGITPAGAGKTFLDEPEKEEQWDHPRRCGENFAGMDKPEGMTGSPPQVRGKLERLHEDCAITGITPAGAGKTRRCCAHRPKFQDHPRRCGENGLDRRRDPSGIGSPPQVRGKLLEKIGIEKENGITPAGAGKTARKVHGTSCIKDHPRRCGENARTAQDMRLWTGSPPQVRGKPERNISGRSGFGITPAGAGKTCFVILISSVLQDHPRRCGENRSGTVRTKTTRGSPPQVRGKPCCAFVTASRSRITPAGAGKTRYSCRMCSRSRDHPRRCGENKETMTEDAENAGSPPQVRGKLQLNAQYRLGRRITPAGAGKTTHTMEV